MNYLENYINDLNDYVEFKFLDKFLINKNPKSLLKYMSDNINYGVEYKGKIYKGNELDSVFDLYGDDKIRVLQPDELYKNEIGTCYDQTIFEYVCFNKLGYTCDMYYIFQFPNYSHSYVVFMKDNKFFHFENAFFNYRGIHGPYSNPNQIRDDVYKHMVMEGGREDMGYSFAKLDPKKYVGNYNLTYKKFFDYSKVS